MAKVKRVTKPAKKKEEPKKEPIKQNISSIAVKTHQIRFDGVAGMRGESGWRCSCGYIYPKPPAEVLGTSKLYDWLDPLKQKHEAGG